MPISRDLICTLIMLYVILLEYTRIKNIKGILFSLPLHKLNIPL